jgi:hypothetical protein
MADLVQKTQNRGGSPVYMRGIEVIVESFIKGSSDALATKELMAFVKEVKGKIYADPAGLGKLAHNVGESQYSRVHRPPAGDHVAGIGIVFIIVYVEDTKNY